MKAIVQDEYGSPDVLELRNIDQPENRDREVLVRVHAAGVDRGVWHLMTGMPYLMRVIGFGLRAPKNPVRGREVAGVVVAVGKDVTSFKPGDEVYGIGEGSFAEYVRVREDKVAPKPANLSFEQAAVVPVSGSTALQGVRDKGRIQPGQKVLIIGASGGVGTFAVQIAKSFGADVTGVCSTTKMDLVRSLGADHVIDYTSEDFAEKEHYYDVILDTGGHSTLSQLRRALTRKGTLVIVGSETDGRLLGGFDRSIRAMLLSAFVGQKLVALTNSENAEDLISIKELIEADKVTPVMDRTFSLSEAPKAIHYLKEGHARGKVAITVLMATGTS
jgi:NADPH:quinone reductase-like Zn-dependent oxidoreductase